MQTFKIFCLLHPFLLVLNFWLTTSTPRDASTSICGKFKIQTPVLTPNSTASSPLNHIVICKSQKLYHTNRTSINLFPISYTNYKCKSLSISQPCRSSPAGFLSSQNSNPPVLFNCSNKKLLSSPLFQNLTSLQMHACGASSKIEELQLNGLASSSCLLVDDLTKFDMAFHPRYLNCSCYSRVYRKPSDGNNEGYKLRTRISFDIPDHVPNICDECQKSNGNCAAGLRCICHPKECKNKVISKGGSINALGNILVALLSLVTVLMVLAVNP